MGLQYTRSAPSAPQGAETAAGVQEEQTYDIVEKRQEMTNQLVNSKEVDDLVSTISVDDQQTIVSFGADVAEEIAKCSDAILNNVNMDQINESGTLLKTLGTIMDKFDIQEITADEKKGVFSKMFGGLQKQLDRILAKYHTMGEEVDKIYIQLKEYEAEINESNRKLDSIFEANVNFYQDLVKYILAGEQGLREIDQYLDQMRAENAQNPDNMLQLDINNLEQARIILDQRVQDLRIAENVAMQSVPMIQSMRFSNLNLIRKINSAFIITLPVFKQALTQAVLLKRQKIQAEAMQALDERTNEMLLKNAQNTADTTRMTARMASTSSVKVETLEQTWKTIVQGIEDTQKIQEQATVKRQQDAQRLNAIKEDFAKRIAM